MADLQRLRVHLLEPVRTHWDGCIYDHTLCALAWALNEVEALRHRADELQRENEFLRRQEASRG